MAEWKGALFPATYCVKPIVIKQVGNSCLQSIIQFLNIKYRDAQLASNDILLTGWAICIIGRVHLYHYID